MIKLGLKLFIFVLFICLILFFYKRVEGFVSGEITMSYNISILGKDLGKGVFKKYKKVDNYNDREISARSKFQVKTRNNKLKKKEMMDMYINSVMDFNPDEKQSIINGVKYLYSKYKGKVPLIKDFKFIKLSKQMDWGYPFTIDEYIIFPAERISSNRREMARLIFHEQLHIIQRKHPKIFKDFYEKHWKFESYNLPDDDWINTYLVRNPDSDDFYKMKLTDDLYIIPLPSTYDKHFKFQEVAIFLNNDGKILAKGENPYIVPLRQIVDYTVRFYNAESLYHPNEIFATLLTSMLFNDLSVSEIDHKGIDELFKLLKKYF